MTMISILSQPKCFTLGPVCSHPLHLGWKPWAAAVLSAGLLELPFPLAGPSAAMALGLCVVRAGSAALGSALPPAAKMKTLHDRALKSRCAAHSLLAYLCGVLWYMGNCYWIRDTMMHYGDMPPLGAGIAAHWHSAWCSDFTSVCSGWALRWCSGPRVPRAWRWPLRHFSGPGWILPPRASPAFPGTSLAIRRSTTR